MTNQNKPPFNTVPHYIASDYRGGELSINQLRLLLWLRLIGTPYGIATTSLVDLKNDVFPDLDLKINTINSMLLKLRQKQHVFFEPRQGKAGTFDIKLNHWMKPKKKYQTLDKFFPEPRQWISTEGEATVEDSYPQAKPPEASQKSEGQNQKLIEERDRLINKVSVNSETRQIRSYHNEHDTEHQLENHDTLEKVSFKGTLVKDYQPTNYEEQQCRDIANEVGETYINPLLKALRTDGFRRIEQAWGIYREDRAAGKKIDKPAAYFFGIIKKLRENQ
ncbi:MAG: hypothetical protein A3I86_01630 [Candidatus Zambryskibacteria bacterium RIFCSPLOWO2_02_FULL_39_14]|uniref:Uncharacterized protein n=1 Tax=Candidatus Zambryskibacteria bacterium RIFCSPLOWO2_02_FULL_39_14 TaxID=1802769 RepID=A0A1G2UJ01_9BACT|nr:MAG: hypothetical protein A3A56_01010 [Candidatus Roizmanbacteria bacterium RIFCSPLOWO2_01_FULL_40_32]OHB09393.1 MAG: hypothetical protein A3I86_01630 [Candidatus Zambryskibacteria bacterium RIFCSPLOWO2_02_FULL_39_14]